MIRQFLKAGFNLCKAFLPYSLVSGMLLIGPGQALLAISEPEVWVVANLKETQMEKVRVGQPVSDRKSVV